MSCTQPWAQCETSDKALPEYGHEDILQKYLLLLPEIKLGSQSFLIHRGHVLLNSLIIGHVLTV